MDKFAMLLLCLSISVEGARACSEGFFVVEGKYMNCKGHLDRYGQNTFCGNSDVFLSECCSTWPATCTRNAQGKLPCLGDEASFTVSGTSKSCDGHLNKFGKRTFCSEANSGIFEARCCKSYTDKCEQSGGGSTGGGSTGRGESTGGGSTGTGTCTETERFSVNNKNLNCKGHLAAFGQPTFCGNPNIFQSRCRSACWPAACTRDAQGKLPCLADAVSFSVNKISRSCDGHLKAWGKKSFCSKENSVFKDNCCKSYTDTCKQSVWKAPKNAYVVELLIVVDPKAQTPYLAENNGRHYQAEQSIKKDIDYFLTEVNKLYANFIIPNTDLKIQVSKKKVILMDRDIVDYGKANGKLVNAEYLLRKFNAYLESNGLKEKYNYDHAVYFSGYDFYDTNFDDNDVCGLATLGAACAAKRASSIVEYDGTYNVVGTTAHEIGHNLGATHDSKTSPYVMAPSNTNNDERWSFSRLSGTNLKTYIADLDAVGKNCLTDNSYATLPNTDITTALADPDTVCARRFGDDYYYDGTIGLNDEKNPIDRRSGDNMCNKINCRSDLWAQEGRIRYNSSAVYTSDGVTCGKRKTCNEGKCLYSGSSYAASQVTDEKCIFGDVKFENSYKGTTCDEALRDNKNSFCNLNKKIYKARCCATWAKNCGGQGKKRSLLNTIASQWLQNEHKRDEIVIVESDDTAVLSEPEVEESQWVQLESVSEYAVDKRAESTTIVGYWVKNNTDAVEKREKVQLESVSGPIVVKKDEVVIVESDDTAEVIPEEVVE